MLDPGVPSTELSNGDHAPSGAAGVETWSEFCSRDGCKMMARISSLSLIVLILVPFSAPFQTYDVAQILVQRHSRQEPAPARASTDLRASASHVIPASRIAARVRLIGDSDSRTRTVVVAHPFSSARSAALQPPPHSPLSATAKLRI